MVQPHGATSSAGVSMLAERVSGLSDAVPAQRSSFDSDGLLPDDLFNELATLGLFRLPSEGSDVTALSTDVSGTVTAVQLSDVSGLRRALTRTPQQSELSFGANVIPLEIADMAGTHLAMSAIRAVGLVLFVVAFAAIWLVTRASYLRFVTASILVIVGGGVFVAAYLLGTSWDCRLMFLGILFAGVARVATTAPAAVWLVGMLLMSMFVTYPLGRLQYVADVVWLATAPFLAVLVVRLLLHRSTVGRRHPSLLRPV